MKVLKKIGVIIMIEAVLTACFFVSGCAIGYKEDNISTVVIGTTSKIEKAIRDEYAYDVLASGVSEMPLIAKSATGEYLPLVADFATTDSKAWTFTIKEGLTWSDGVPVTANDIVFSLNYEESIAEKFQQNPVVSEDNKSVILQLKSKNVKALDDMTTFRIRPQHIYENKDVSQITTQEARVSCGPYTLSDFNKQANTLNFVINEFYPQRPNVEQVTYKLFDNEELLYASLMSGDIDMVWNYSMGVDANYQKLLGGVSSVTLESVAATNCPAMLVFNNSRGLFADKDLRFAVSYALDYQAFKEYFGSPYVATPNRSFAPSTIVGYVETEQLKNDINLASQFMSKAGYSKSGKWWQKEDKAAEFSLTVNASKTNHIGYAEFVKTQLEEFGIKVNLESVDATTYNVKTSNKYATEKGSGVITMEAAIMGYTAYGMQNLGDMYIDGNHAVQGGAQVFSDTLTAIREEISSADTLDQYLSATAKLQNFYVEQTPAIALYWDSMILAHSAKLDNLVVDSTFGLNNVNTWFSITKK